MVNTVTFHVNLMFQWKMLRKDDALFTKISHDISTFSRTTGPNIGLFVCTHFDALSILIPNVGAIFIKSEFFLAFLMKNWTCSLLSIENHVAGVNTNNSSVVLLVEVSPISMIRKIFIHQIWRSILQMYTCKMWRVFYSGTLVLCRDSVSLWHMDYGDWCRESKRYREPAT